MAWEWVAPVATGVTGIVGVGFTWWAGHQGRRHAERVADKAATSQLALAREARRAAAYREVIGTVTTMTAACNQITAIFKYQGEEDWPLPSLDIQIATSATIRLYGSREALDLYDTWLAEARKLLSGHVKRQVARKAGRDRPADWEEQDAARAAMNSLAAELYELMNGELAS